MPESFIEEVHKSLFHYTGESGLFGILSSQTLWATHHLFLNDKQEMDVFITAFKGFLDANYDGPTPEIKIRDIEDFGKILTSHRDEMREKAPAYVTCFCVPNKSGIKNFEYLNGRLSQWRGYSEDAGYAIEFDTSLLNQLLVCEATKDGDAKHRYMHGSLSAVAYYSELDKIEFHRDNDEDDTTEQLKIKMQELVSMFYAGKTDRKKQKDNVFMNQYMSKIGECAARIKHYGFHEENEVRIIAFASSKKHLEGIRAHNSAEIVSAPENIHYRTSDNAPYIILFKEDQCKTIFKKAVKGVIVGPGEDQERRIVKIRMLLTQHGYDDAVYVRSSNIPYLT
ncbi:MAG: DUF2971 domain-containing protein [Alphaproteobacteria bacterium]|nr:DUF2971 domain-containing protein [Alphaproteobacteria bacterium]